MFFKISKYDREEKAFAQSKNKPMEEVKPLVETENIMKTESLFVEYVKRFDKDATCDFFLFRFLNIILIVYNRNHFKIK